MSNRVVAFASSVVGFVQRRKVVTTCLLIVVAVFVLLKVQPSAIDDASEHIRIISNKIANMTRDSRMLENILQASYKPKYNGDTIFFLETSPRENKSISLLPRQACSIEAAGELIKLND